MIYKMSSLGKNTRTGQTHAARMTHTIHCDRAAARSHSPRTKAAWCSRKRHFLARLGRCTRLVSQGMMAARRMPCLPAETRSRAPDLVRREPRWPIRSQEDRLQTVREGRQAAAGCWNRRQQNGFAAAQV